MVTFEMSSERKMVKSMGKKQQSASESNGSSDGKRGNLSCDRQSICDKDVDAQTSSSPSNAKRNRELILQNNLELPSLPGDFPPVEVQIKAQAGKVKEALQTFYEINIQARDQLQKEVDQLKSQNDSLADSLSKSNDKVQELQKQLTMTKASMLKMQAEAEQSKEGMRPLISDLLTLRGVLSHIDEEMKNRDKEIEGLKKEVKKVKARSVRDIEEHEQYLSRLEKKIHSFVGSVQDHVRSLGSHAVQLDGTFSPRTQKRKLTLLMDPNDSASLTTIVTSASVTGTKNPGVTGTSAKATAQNGRATTSAGGSSQRVVVK